MLIDPEEHILELTNDTHSASNQYVRGEAIAPNTSLRDTPTR